MAKNPPLYLDADTTPPIESRYGFASLDKSMCLAFVLLAEVQEGQIGIYENHLGKGFKGYAIKYPDREIYFEPAENTESAS